LTVNVAHNTEPGTDGGPRASVKLDEMLHEGEPDAEPGVTTRRSGIDLSKRSKRCGSCSGAMPVSSVADRDLDVEFVRCRWSCTRPPFGVNFTAFIE
jgi:hypothetical protein